MGFLGGGSEPPPHQLGVLEEPVALKIWIFEHFGTSEIMSNGQLLLNLGTISESGGACAPCPNVEPPLIVLRVIFHVNLGKMVGL